LVNTKNSKNNWIKSKNFKKAVKQNENKMKIAYVGRVKAPVSMSLTYKLKNCVIEEQSGNKIEFKLVPGEHFFVRIKRIDKGKPFSAELVKEKDTVLN
jgi:hypothetical protein